MGDPNLVTTCNFHGQEYLFKMNVLNSNLEILITDKSSGEEWQCSYDATYIENLTHKTGNFKQFEIFVAMIKSGLLRTSESVTLDLLTFEDLELLRSRKIAKTVGPNNNNRRYLIVTYAVEFDKIRYPLPLEYCGPPDPVILQATIRRLELELAKAREELAIKASNSEAKKIYFLQKRVDELTEENVHLQEEIRQLNKLLGKKPKTQVLSLQKAVSNLEKCVVSERNSHHELVEKLRSDKIQLARELEKVKQSEKCLKAKMNKTHSKMGFGDFKKPQLSNKPSCESIKTMYKRGQTPVCDRSRDIKTTDSQMYTRKAKSRHRPKTAARSRDSSTSSTKYGDAELDFPNNLHSRTPSPFVARSKNRQKSRCSSADSTEKKSIKARIKSRCSSADSRSSSKTSSRASHTKAYKPVDRDYKNLERKVAELQQLMKKDYAMCDSDK